MDSPLTPTAPADAVIAGPSPAAPKPRRRRRRWLIALVCLLVLVTIPVGGYFFLAWHQERELDELIADLDAADPNWRLDDLLANRPAVPDEENPTLVILKVDALLRPGSYDVGPGNYRLFEQNTPPVNRPNALQITALRESFSKYGKAREMARTLKDYRAEGRFNIKVAPDFLSTNLDPLQRARNVMWLLQNDVMLRAEEEDGAGAMESSRAGLVTARAIGREPYLIAALIRFAGQAIAVNSVERTLAQTEPPAAQLVAMQQLLALEIEAPVLVDAMRGERAGDDQLLLHLQSGKIKMSTLMGGLRMGGRNSVEDWVLDYLPISVTGGRPEFLRMMNKNVEATKLPPNKQGAAFAELEKEAKSSSSVYVRLLLPACSKVSSANCRIHAQMHCAIVGLAAERYRITHGEWPAALADLCKEGLLSAVPVDPFDSRPLRYKVLPDGVMIYSVGTDGEDNGGTIDRERVIGPGLDIGFQLWNVPARRQAPLPPPPRVE
jgi:hypothetical protein